MAKKVKAVTGASPAAATPQIPETFEAEALYKVRVGRTCSAASVDFSPVHAYTVKGRVAEEIRGHLVSAEAV